MTEDPIIAEVRRFREDMASKFGYDVAAIVKDARKRQKTSKHKIVSLKGSKKHTS